MGILNTLEDLATGSLASEAVGKVGEMLGFDKKTDDTDSPQTIDGAADTDSSALAQDSTDTNDAVDNQSAPAAQTYTVQAGDSLSTISEHFYGNSHDYMKIFEANQDTLNDPNDIEIGQELTIPTA